jgi:hypothetical protein
MDTIVVFQESFRISLKNLVSKVRKESDKVGIASSEKLQRIKEIVADYYRRNYCPLIWNRSGSERLVKPGNGTANDYIPAYGFTSAPIDGIVTKEGKVLKITDVGCVEILPNGDLNIHGLAYELNERPDDGWIPIFQAADDTAKAYREILERKKSSSSSESDGGSDVSGRTIFVGDVNIDPNISATA